MKLASIFGAVLLCLAPLVHAQSGTPRAWQQRIEVEIDLPVPIVALESANPFAIPVDQPPRLLTSTPPKKLNVEGIAQVAAYVNPKGDCLGGVPLELPFPGLTTAILEEIKGVRFDPAKTGNGAVGSWVVLGLDIVGRVKESSVGSPTFELPDPASPPEPATPLGTPRPCALRTSERADHLCLAPPAQGQSAWSGLRHPGPRSRSHHRQRQMRSIRSAEPGTGSSSLAVRLPRHLETRARPEGRSAARSVGGVVGTGAAQDLGSRLHRGDRPSRPQLRAAEHGALESERRDGSRLLAISY